MNEKNVRSIPELFGSMVFSQAQMRQRLPERVYDAWQQCLIQGTSLDRSIADEIAAAMKDWAIEKGATHYTHWFQPMTGGRLQLPLRRSAGHLRGPWLYGVGSHVLCLHQGSDPVYPHHLLFLRRRDAG